MKMPSRQTVATGRRAASVDSEPRHDSEGCFTVSGLALRGSLDGNDKGQRGSTSMCLSRCRAFWDRSRLERDAWDLANLVERSDHLRYGDTRHSFP